MKADDLRKVAAKIPLSAATIARNPMTAEAHNALQSGHYRFISSKPLAEALVNAAMKLQATPGKRIRQDELKLYPWEKEWKDYLGSMSFWQNVRAQSLRFRLARGAWYKPDVSATQHGKLYCWEVKGGAKMKGVAKGILALKVAASLYPEIVWTLCWKERGEWKTQEVLP